MPRNVRYRKNWTADNGYQWRLDIIPADHLNTFDHSSATVVELGDGALIKISNLEWGFRDDLPVGLIEEPACKITIDSAELPSDLITYLADPISPGSETSSIVQTNLFILWCDRSNDFDSTTHEIVYIGVQTPSLSQDLEVGAGGSTQIEITTQGALTHCLQRCGWNNLRRFYNLNPAMPEIANPEQFVLGAADFTLYDPYPDTPTGAAVGDRWTTGITYRPEGNKFVYWLALADIFETMRVQMASIWRHITRQSSTTFDETIANLGLGVFDWGYQKIYGDITYDGAAVQLYRAQNVSADLTDRIGTALKADEIFVPAITWGHDTLTKSEWAGFISDNDPGVGGIFSKKDNQSWPAQYANFHEFMKTLGESTFVKFIPQYSFTSSLLKCDLTTWLAFSSPFGDATFDLDLLAKSKSDKVKLSIGYTSTGVDIGIPAGLQATLPIGKQSAVDGSLATQQQFSIKNIPLHNSIDATDPDPALGNAPKQGYFRYSLPDFGYGNELAFKLPYPCTMLGYYFGEPSTCWYLKAAEKIYIWGGFLSLYDGAATDDFSSLLTSNYLEFREWIIARQLQYSMTYAVSSAWLKLLADRRNWTITDAAVMEGDDALVTWNAIGNVIQSNPPSTHPHLPNLGVITKIGHDVQSGLSTLTTFMPGALFFG